MSMLSQGSVFHAVARPIRFTRRRFGLLLASAAAIPVVPTLAATLSPGGSVQGLFPNLAFTMTRASDGKVVTAADYRGDVAVVYFGFTRCPDTCPLTMQNAARVLAKMGPLAHRVRVLFVTVDLAYDSLPRLKSYLANFGNPPEFDGLRGTPAQLAAFAKRYAVAYKAPTRPDAPDPISKISHSAAVYLFDAQGRAQQILGRLGTAKPAIAATATDLDRFARRAQG
jgi:protein SCO1/2